MDNNLPLGFRFYPTEEELISFYLRNKLEGTRPELDRVIPVLDIYQMDPSQLPQFSGELCRGDPEQWFFFVPRQAREARGGRTSRTTGSGYWKATGSLGYAYSSGNRIIGLKKTMVFYKGKAPCGRKTKWKMNEYKAVLGGESSSSTSASPNPLIRHEYSLCLVYIVRGVCDHHQNPPKMEKSDSQDSSSSGGDQPHPPHTGESTVWEISDDDFKSLLEWKNLIWD